MTILDISLEDLFKRLSSKPYGSRFEERRRDGMSDPGVVARKEERRRELRKASARCTTAECTYFLRVHGARDSRAHTSGATRAEERCI